MPAAGNGWWVSGCPGGSPPTAGSGHERTQHLRGPPLFWVLSRHHQEEPRLAAAAYCRRDVFIIPKWQQSVVQNHHVQESNNNMKNTVSYVKDFKLRWGRSCITDPPGPPSHMHTGSHQCSACLLQPPPRSPRASPPRSFRLCWEV